MGGSDGNVKEEEGRRVTEDVKKCDWNFKEGKGRRVTNGPKKCGWKDEK